MKALLGLCYAAIQDEVHVKSIQGSVEAGLFVDSPVRAVLLRARL
jgi:hypothetical protein